MYIFNDNKLPVIDGFQFSFVQELEPERDSAGQIIQYVPQDDSGRYKGRQLNKHGNGPFCRFSLSSEWIGRCGVYALFAGEEILYIGECQDLNNRFNSGYGHISYRNCLYDGQSTNCKINSMILRRYLNGGKVLLFFYETNDYKRVEDVLLRKLNPLYNGKKSFVSYPIQPHKKATSTQPPPSQSMKTAGLAEWLKVIAAFSPEKIELHTIPKSKSRAPVWFSVYAKGDEIFIGGAKVHSPSSSLAAARRLSYAEFERMYPIYLKRKAGHSVSAEATKASHNQVYWYAIMDYCGL